VAGGFEVLGETPFDGVARWDRAGAGRERWVRWLATALADPDLEHGDGLAGEGSDSFFPAFAERRQVRFSAELQVGACRADRFGDGRAALHGGE